MANAAIDEIVEKIAGLSAMDLADLSKAIQDKFGVTAAAPMAMPAGHGSGMDMSAMLNLPKAQAAKDATMAYFILENWTEGKTFFHFNGSYHSDHFEGIVWHLKQENPGLKIMTIATVQQEDLDSLSEENDHLANFILCVPENMTRTQR